VVYNIGLMIVLHVTMFSYIAKINISIAIGQIHTHTENTHTYTNTHIVQFQLQIYNGNIFSLIDNVLEQNNNYNVL